MAYQYETLTVEIADYIATLTINRPDRRNALNPTAYRELAEAFRAFQDDMDVRCIILTGADPAFCSGEDVKEMMNDEAREKSVKAMKSSEPQLTPTARAILECDVPIIAAINGAAVGWGMELALFTDIRIASDKAKMGEIFIKRGLITDVGGLWRLPRIVGAEKAAELVLTGDVISGAEAKELGLVSRCVAHDDLMAEARALAGRIACNAPLALRGLKQGLREGYHGTPDQIGSWVTAKLADLFQTADHREGVQSFLEKRQPVFAGK